MCHTAGWSNFAARAEAVPTCVVQIEGQEEVEEEVRKLLCGVGGQPVLHHAQEKLNKLGIQVFWENKGRITY